MNLVFNLHSYVPEQMSGAETMAHRMAKYLASKGHKVTVICGKPDKMLDGVVVRKEDPGNLILKEADLVFTHLGQTGDSFNKARFYKKKLIHIAHNSFDYPTVRCRIQNNFIVYNSHWVKETLNYKQEGFVLYPPVDYREYTGVKPGKYVTLVNLNENKGGQILIELAKRLPEVQFMGVEGGYYDQIKDESLTNIKYVPPAQDIRSVLKQTRILIAPSAYESWGQIGIEAASSGIPVIASPTPGLKQSLKDGAIFCERDNLDEWVKAIKSLENQKAYAEWGKKAKVRAIELDPVPQLEAFEKWLIEINKRAYI